MNVHAKQTLINAHVLNVSWISMAFLTQLMEIVCNVIATMAEVHPTFVEKIEVGGESFLMISR